MHPPIDGHGTPDRRFARLPPRPLGRQAAHPEAPGAGMRPLHIEHLLKEGERELIGRVRRRARALILQPSEAITLERLQDVCKFSQIVYQ
jgi:hypothetical protein